MLKPAGNAGEIVADVIGPPLVIVGDSTVIAVPFV